MTKLIKIFTCLHKQTKYIENSIITPIHIGAAVSKSKIPGVILSDDTGDNRSTRDIEYGELTAQYWAWKNIKADYYGMCHYRRYLSFAEREFETDEFGMVPAFYLNHSKAEEFGLLNAQNMKNIIEHHDMVVAKSSLIAIQPTPKGKVKTVRELWEAHDGLFITSEAIDEMFRLIETFAPDYSNSANAYFSGGYHRGYNCYVMRAELFHRLCDFQFPILFKLEQWLKTKSYCNVLPRIPAYIGEMMYGIFVYHITNCENRKVKECQLIFFKNTQKIKNRFGLVCIYLHYWISKAVRKIVDILFPKGSRRRIVAKSYYYRLKNVKNLFCKKKNEKNIMGRGR